MHTTPGTRHAPLAMDVMRPAGIFRTPPRSSAQDPLRWLWSADRPALGRVLVALAGAAALLVLLAAAR